MNGVALRNRPKARTLTSNPAGREAAVGFSRIEATTEKEQLE